VAAVHEPLEREIQEIARDVLGGRPRREERAHHRAGRRAREVGHVPPIQ
jgi:hypothetical protein